MADPKVTKSPKTPSSCPKATKSAKAPSSCPSSRIGEKKLHSTSTPMSTPKKTPRKTVVVDQFLVVPRNLSLLESNHSLPNENQQLKKLPESRKQPKVVRQLEMNEPSPPQPPSVSTPRIPSAKNRQHFCDTCKIYCSSLTSMNQHNAGRRHRIYTLYKEWDKLKANRNGVVVTSPSASSPEAEKISVELANGKKKVVEFYIKNLSDSIVAFERCDVVDLKSATRRRFTDFQLKNRPAQQPLPPNAKLIVSLHCVRHAIGFYCTKVAFVFSEPKMTIVRDVEVQIVTQMMKDLGPKSPYKHPPRVSVKMAPVKTVDGLRLKWDRSKDNLTQAVPLDPYGIPVAVRRALNHGLQEEDEPREKTCNIKSLLTSSLCKDNYRNRFSLLLHIEELQMEVDIRKYDMLKVPLDACKENHKLLTLEVPGLSENRPSVLVGDHLFLRVLKSDKTPEETEYKAYVHRTCLNKVEIGLSENFRNTWLKKMTFNCRFNFNRLPIRMQHRAVQFAEENSLYDLLFPDSDNICRYGCIQPVDTPMKFYNRLIEDNEQQESAVRHIVAGSSRPAPFLIFGPPGTGKTMTMVEAMKQVLKCIPSSKILACAPSNNAADLLAEKLLDHVPKESILRMNAASRDMSQLPQKIKDCSNYNNGCFFPSVSDIMKLKVVVTTLVTAGRLVSANFPPGHFTHIFIDEAGQAVEPESIIPIAGIFESEVATPDGGQVVLAGDPEQLGPVLRSPVAMKYGLADSQLGRYMKTDVYKRRPQATSVSDAYDSRLLVKLVRNYRSHPDILKVPNESFYMNELEACADVLVRESLCQWSELPKKGVPLIFHGVIGKDEREERSPSFFNTAEIAIVVDYVDKLLKTRPQKVLAKEIGIISPYRKQVQKFRQALKKDKSGKCDDITVGTVEEFQGQERRIIIISTVRSSTDFLPLDYDCKLGFLRNPKRFNVSITRAKALLIVVGNPHILCRDVHWNKLLKFCVERGVYVGCEFNNPTLDTDDELEECMEDLGKLQLSDTESSVPISSLAQLVEPEWRNGL